MRKLRYSLVDVFTDRPFGGNQLAVFTDAHDLSSDVMQALAKEFNSRWRRLRIAMKKGKEHKTDELSTVGP